MTFLSNVPTPLAIITAIDASIRFPEILVACKGKYSNDIQCFKEIVAASSSSAELLGKIRSPRFTGDERMSLLKMFRRCVSPVIDTEMAKKVTKIPTAQIVSTFGHTFKDIRLLQQQFLNISSDQEAALAALIGEYDTRGQLGYLLTDKFFNWFEGKFKNEFTIEGPRGAGRDIELSTVLDGYTGNYPCDFVIRQLPTNNVVAVGFARYDSTRGGAQSDDRTGGNSDKVSKAKEFCTATGKSLRLVFLADGPGLAHKDTWEEACKLDNSWGGNVRVVTLKTAETQISPDWLAHS